MKKKRDLIMVIFVLVLFIASALPTFGSADEYKVIKNAVNSKNSSGSVSWFKLEVKDKKENKTTVKIKVPLSLLELISDCEKDEVQLAGKCKVNLKQILAELKKNGPMTLIEVDGEDELVKIWFE